MFSTHLTSGCLLRWETGKWKPKIAFFSNKGKTNQQFQLSQPVTAEPPREYTHHYAPSAMRPILKLN